MTTIMCQNCGSLFYGRPNRAYCSPSCKSVANNRSYAKLNKNARDTERMIRANRRILMDLFKIFGAEPFPYLVIEKSKLDIQFNSGVAKDGSAFMFLDIVLKDLSNQNCKIIKIPIS